MADEPLPDLSSLDRYAPVYTPAWLLAINHAPGTFVPQLENAVVDYEAYSASLFPTPLWRRMDQERTINQRSLQAGRTKTAVGKASLLPAALEIVNPHTKEYAAIAPPTAAPTPKDVPAEVIPDLAPIYYGAHFLPMLGLEYSARTRSLFAARLYNVPLLYIPPLPDDNAYSPVLWKFEAKSIREGHPPVDLGDAVLLRQLRPEETGWQGLIFVACVWGLNRAKGEIVVRCDALRGYVETMSFNVVWQAQDRLFYAMTAGVECLHRELMLSPVVKPAAEDGDEPGTTESRSIVEQVLFPEMDDLRPLSQGPEKLSWINEMLNEEQQQAVSSIVFGAGQVLPLLISGPPGTGKTSVLVEAVLQILRTRPTVHILLCGASNPSADTLATRLAAALQPKDLFRLNDASRPFTEVRGELLPFCFSENERFALPPIKLLLAKRVIVTSCVDASLLLSARCTNLALSRLESQVSSAIHPLLPPSTVHPHFAYFLLDEAAQASEPETAVPLAVVLTGPSRHPCRIAICGDTAQLGPAITSETVRDLEMGVSILERLGERKVYRDHPWSRRNRRRFPGVKWDVRVPCVSLVRNYRSHASILMLPSTLFYDESLIPCAPQSSLLHSFSRLPTPGFPILFLGVKGVDEPQDEGASFYNLAEIDEVVALVLELVTGKGGKGGQAHGNVRASEISVISPYREQVWRIRLKLRELRLNDVDVGNVEALQGAENRIVIISTVRSNPRWLASDRSQARGLIHESKRWNVAMTRAKELLLVVGNAETLMVDPNWRSFYLFCVRNGAYQGPKIGLGMGRGLSDGAENISRLEERFRSTSLGVQGDAEDDEKRRKREKRDRDAAWDVLVGSVTRETLLEG